MSRRLLDHPLSRRALLRGFGGTAVALPFLEAMLPRKLAHAAAGSRRYLVTFGGLSTGNPTIFTPTKVGADYDLRPGIMPLSAVKNEISIVTGLRMPQNGAGGWGGRWHSSSMGPLVSGVSATGGAAPGNPLGHGTPVARGPTSDQVVADALGGMPRFRSLELRVQPEVYRENDGTFGIMSYRKDAAGKLQANEPQASPRLAYDAIFTGFAPTDPGTGGALQAQLAQDKSVLDLVRSRSEKLFTRLGTADRQRVQRHFDEIRDLEKRLIDIPEIPQTASCQKLPDPGQDDPVNKFQAGIVCGNESIPRYLGYANEEKRARVMSDLIHVAFACDLTQVASLVYTFAQSFIDTKELLGLSRTDMHDIGHEGSDDAKAACLAWHLKHFAYLVGKLRDTPDGTGTLLDNTVLVFLAEGGWNGDPHTAENMMALIAGGRAGGLKPGKHVVATGKHPVNVVISAMNAAGVPATQLGEIKGAIPELST